MPPCGGCLPRPASHAAALRHAGSVVMPPCGGCPPRPASCARALRQAIQRVTPHRRWPVRGARRGGQRPLAGAAAAAGARRVAGRRVRRGTATARALWSHPVVSRLLLALRSAWCSARARSGGRRGAVVGVTLWLSLLTSRPTFTPVPGVARAPCPRTTGGGIVVVPLVSPLATTTAVTRIVIVPSLSTLTTSIAVAGLVVVPGPRTSGATAPSVSSVVAAVCWWAVAGLGAGRRFLGGAAVLRGRATGVRGAAGLPGASAAVRAFGLAVFAGPGATVRATRAPPGVGRARGAGGAGLSAVRRVCAPRWRGAGLSAVRCVRAPPGSGAARSCLPAVGSPALLPA